MFTRFVLLPLLTGCLLACQPAKKSSSEAGTTGTASQPSAPIPYDLTKVAERYDLPDDLHEVSGLSYYKPGQLACIQDELAVVFIYDLKQRTVADEIIFGRKGDYEGVEWVKDELYALRSDGEVYRFPAQASGNKEVHHIKTGLQGKNDIEGLGYDPKLDALLLMTKDADRHGSDKLIYYYGLKAATVYQGPVLKQADLQAIDPSGEKEIKPSGIAVHPKTGDYYILASVGHRLIVMTPGGKVQSSVALDKALFEKPEGICFTPDGTLFIASEGAGKKEKGYILQFSAQ